MEATVTIALKEVEKMKSTIERLEREISRLEAQKDFRLSIDGELYDWKYSKRVFSSRILTFGHAEEVTQKGYLELRNEMETLFNKFINESIYLKFYSKFPRWFHKIFKCD